LRFLKADWIISCDDNFNIIENGAIVFDDKIVDIGLATILEEKYSKNSFEYCGKNSLLMPGLINAHIHLEFSANKTTLIYGNFMKWLYSVIENREVLIEKATTKLISNKLKNMQKSGTTTIGAISSYGFDMEACIKSDLNVVYFTEVIGSKMDMIDTLFTDFKAKFDSVKVNKNDKFIPAIAIHSPYSVHPFLIREVLKIAQEEDTIVSAHFMESKGENQWLNYSNGEFSEFFKNFLQQDKSLVKPFEFLNQFKQIKNLSFTHCVEANKDELEQINKLDASVIHCPKSNRLLNNTNLNLDYIEDINLAMGTDGLSSNNSLNMFDEMQSALFTHTNQDLEKLAQRLLIASTKGGAKALGLNKGELSKGYDADIISIQLVDDCTANNLASSIILHTKYVENTYIKGQKYEIS
jgi:cytosine/adenosine deaminase-related metal-dependent hydrolase